MKTFIYISIIATLGLSATSLHSHSATREKGGPWAKVNSHNMVWIVGADASDPRTLHMKTNAVNIYSKSVKTGFQQSGVPNFIITDRSQKAIFGIGGFANFRTAYDWDNVVGNRDFITYTIPMSGNPSNAQRFLMDPTISRLFFKTIINTQPLGPIEAYIETDFRGNNGALHLREAYVSFKGWTFGQTATTFVDLDAAPNTIDFQGPNAYTYNRNVMIRYNHKFNNHWEIAVAAEMPGVSATPGTHSMIIPQRVPDIPAYVQYNWNRGKSHVRASGLLRTMYYYNDVRDNTYAQMGWGAQLSGSVALCPFANFYGMIVYGKGITNYIQDLNGTGMDLVSTPNTDSRLSMLPSMGWLAGLQMNFNKRWQMNIGYSQVNLWDNNGYFQANPNAYQLSQYVVGNLFFNILPSLQVGAEYLYGTRYDADMTMGKANRAQMMVQFTF